jgi:alpha-tubulin suppressor-like RCC1 family protein
VQGISKVLSVCGGQDYSAALRADASVWTWGSNDAGTLGDGTQNSAAVPVQVLGLSAVSAIACGNNHVLALRRDGTVWAWGANEEGSLGDGSTAMRLQPVQVPGLTQVMSIAAGEYFSAALKHDGSVWEWGIVNAYTNPRGAPRLLPVQAVGVSGAVAIGASINSFYLLAIHADQQTWWRGRPEQRRSGRMWWASFRQ